MGKVLRSFIVVTFTAAILQYAWEYWQCGIFYNMDANTQQSALM